MENPELNGESSQDPYEQYRNRAALTPKEIEKSKENREIAANQSQFFGLEIGQEAKNRTSGELELQVRYHLDDLRDPENPVTKTWDTFPNVSVLIEDALQAFGKFLVIRCHRGTKGGKNYKPCSPVQLGQPWEVDIQKSNEKETKTDTEKSDFD
jgi:hypothetical protein